MQYGLDWIGFFVFISKILFKRSNATERPHWLRLQWMDIWMWSIDCWIAKKLMLICWPRWVEKINFVAIPSPKLSPIFFFGCYVVLIKTFGDDKKKCSVNTLYTHWGRLHGVDIWMWWIDCWTAKTLMLICRIKWVEIVAFVNITSPKFSPLFFFFGCWFWLKTLVMIKKNAAVWIHCTDAGFKNGTFGCGQSTIGLQRHWC